MKMKDSSREKTMTVSMTRREVNLSNIAKMMKMQGVTTTTALITYSPPSKNGLARTNIKMKRMTKTQLRGSKSRPTLRTI